MTMLKKFLSFILLFFSGICFCQTSDFLKGESLFKENKVEEAVPYLKNAISQGGNPKAYNYLALSYHKLGMYEEAIKDFDIDLAQSYAIGDKIRDLSICKKTSCRGYLISNLEKENIVDGVKSGKYRNTEYAEDLLTAAKKIVGGN